MALDQIPEADVLIKVAVFVLVQGLVYLILTSSSDVFSKSKTMRSLTFTPARCSSISRILDIVSDFPHGGEPSPSPSSSSSGRVSHEQ